MNDSRIRLKLLFSLELQESDISCLHLVQQVKSVRRKGPTSSPISRWCNIKYCASHVTVFQQFKLEGVGRYGCWSETLGAAILYQHYPLSHCV